MINKMVQVFKTDVRKARRSKLLIRELMEHMPGNRINFDLEDIDNILRIEGENIPTENIVLLLGKYGHLCELLS